MKKTKLCDQLGIELPIIQAGMVWVSGAKLAAASSNAGCLGVIGAGSMNLEVLDYHLKKVKKLTSKPVAINLPLLYSKTQEQIDMALSHGIKIFITSAGSPKKYTSYLKNNGAYVIHVTSNLELALKCEQAGVDAVIIEGFEAGGHNGRDELTSLVLMQHLYGKMKIPFIAAGGFSSGRSVLAGLMLGAEAIQMGTRFMMTKESSAHKNYKELLTSTGSNSTKLIMKELVPVRLVKNKFYSEIEDLENTCAPPEKLSEHLGKGRAKLGMLDGDLESGELEAGQICLDINSILNVAELIEKIKFEYAHALGEFR